jgi:lysophospholipase L1-like esterase
MNLRTRALLPLALLLVCICCFNTNIAFAVPAPDHWVGTWAAAPMAWPDPANKFGASDTTLREIVHISIGGPDVRVILTNEFGLDSLTIGAADIALSAGGSDIDPGSSSALSFSGRPSVTIPPGALVISDPVNLKLPPSSNVAVSIFLPAQTISQVTQHRRAGQTNYIAPGNVANAKALDSAKHLTVWPFLKGIDVKAGPKGASIVAFGDSITDGVASTSNANTRWPDDLARRLQSNKKTANLGVLNEGIGGNGILHDITGPNALARFDRDVLAQAGVKYLIILESINDIARATRLQAPEDTITADDLVAGLSQMATRAHSHGIKVIGATLTPYIGIVHASPAGEAMRQTINHWIRTTNQLDGIIDFDKVIQNPANPAVFLPAYDSGDHLHPNDAGYKAMANSIDLNLFTSK